MTLRTDFATLEDALEHIEQAAIILRALVGEPEAKTLLKYQQWRDKKDFPQKVVEDVEKLVNT